jgi:hypothetical protein
MRERRWAEVWGLLRPAQPCAGGCREQKGRKAVLSSLSQGMEADFPSSPQFEYLTDL